MTTYELEQKFVLSDALLKYGYHDLAIAAQTEQNWEIINGFTAIIGHIAISRKDKETINKLLNYGLIG